MRFDNRSATVQRGERLGLVGFTRSIHVAEVNCIVCQTCGIFEQVDEGRVQCSALFRSVRSCVLRKATS